MKLLKLNLKNFKGVKDFTLDTKGKSVHVFGDNATGKTTLFDAFMWLLFGKDSKNKTDFEIKTLDKNNNVLHGLDHEVSGMFEIDSKKLELKKVYREKWTKKRGEARKTFTGHTTDHFIDGVPVKKKEYEEKIANIVDEDVFKLLTNPAHFNEQLHWEERRKILIDVCGDISDLDVIKSDKSLNKLSEILKERNLDDHRKIITSKRNKINKELEKIPVRIDEVQQSIEDISNIDKNELDSSIKSLKNKLDAKHKEYLKIESGGAIAGKEKELNELEGKLIKLRNEQQAKGSEEISKKQKEINELKKQLFKLDSETTKYQTTIDNNKDKIKNLDAEMRELRQAWFDVNKLEFKSDGICPTCGQSIPQSKLQESKEEFNYRKAERLAVITADGKNMDNDKGILETKNKELLNKIKETKELMQQHSKKISDLENKMDNLEDGKETKEVLQLKSEIKAIKAEINSLKSGNKDVVEKLNDEFVEIKNELESLEQKKLQIKQAEQSKKRIKELGQQEKELAKEFEKLEGQLYLIEQFTIKKVELLEGRINSKFKHARFKLFEKQVNGGIKECCETLYKGVPYSSLNNAARINIGLDIINTLSEYHEFNAPIFIDNREAVTKLNEVEGQVISLIVSEDDKKLRVEEVKNG